MVTNSIVAATDESYDIISAVIEQYEKELSLCDIALLPDYGNILFDCLEENAHKLMDILRTEHMDCSWRLMMSEGETIKSIYVFDGINFTSETVGKTMDEITAESQFSCSGNCSDCSSDCHHDNCESHNEHGGDCECEECRAEEFSLEDTIEMFNEIAKESENGFYSTLVNAYIEEMHRFVNEQSEDEEGLDLLMNSVVLIIIAAAACDGTYSLREHTAIEMLIGETDFDHMKKSLPDIIPDDDNLCKSLKYWKAAQIYGYELRRYIIMLCTFVCAVDDNVNEDEYRFLNMLTKA